MKDEVGKMFVGGLSWATSTEKLKQYFIKFGEIVDCSVIFDKVTENSKGFGFVKFLDPESVVSVLNARPHILDDKQIDPKPCTPKEVQKEKQKKELEHIARYKVFVGGLAQTTTEDQVRRYFEKFGTVTNVIFAMNKEDNKNKGFGFVTFEKESAATEAVDIHFHDLGGRRVEVKRAQPRESMRNNTSLSKMSNNQMMPDQNSYPGASWGPMGPWGPSPFPMDGGAVGPSGGYMPDSNYMMNYYNTGNYYPQQTNFYGYNGPPPGYYPDMGSYPQQQQQQQQQQSQSSSSSSSSKSKSSSSANDSRSYHPYKR